MESQLAHESIPDDRLALRREHLMNEIGQGTARVTGGRRRTVAVALVAATVVGVGGLSAAAAVDAVHQNENGVYEVDAAQLQAKYEGRVISREELKVLNEDGKALYSAVNTSSACHGVIQVFDTEAELDAYNKQYNELHPIESIGPTSDGTEDPCK